MNIFYYMFTAGVGYTFYNIGYMRGMDWYRNLVTQPVIKIPVADYCYIAHCSEKSSHYFINRRGNAFPGSYCFKHAYMLRDVDNDDWRWFRELPRPADDAPLKPPVHLDGSPV